MHSLSSIRKIVTRMLLVVGLVATGQASAAAFSNIYVFGDSLSDSGNVAALTGGVFPPTPYWEGRFSNGPTYAEDLAGMLGFSATPSLSGGNNYAFGGATAWPGSTIGPLATDLGSQVSAFRSLSGPADSHALYVLWAGANDLRTTPSVPGILSALGGLGGAVQGLYDEGARDFLVLNMPNLGLTPEATHGGNNAAATLVSAVFNQIFSPLIGNLSNTLQGSHIRTLDTFALLSDAVSRPLAYGLTNVTDDCILAGPACTPDTYLFWDEIHPTAIGHRIIADAAYRALAVPEPSAYALLIAGLGLLRLVTRRRRQGLA